MSEAEQTEVEHLSHQVALMARAVGSVADAIRSADVSQATAEHRAKLEQAVRALRLNLLVGLVLIAVVVVLSNLLTG